MSHCPTSYLTANQIRSNVFQTTSGFSDHSLYIYINHIYLGKGPRSDQGSDSRSDRSFADIKHPNKQANKFRFSESESDQQKILLYNRNY